MPITCFTEENSNLLRTEVTGAVTIPQILDHLVSHVQNGTIGHCEVIDVRGVTSPYLTSAQIWQAAQAVLAIALKSSPGPRAIVVENDTVFGMSRMFSTLVEETFPIRVYREMEAAEHWLLEEYQPVNAI
ncbi:MAG TPA: hypothetical protein VK961_09685 [Chthoniobacter sp.]|nr:hypothetical protein [Chthoniobacter sp.]